LEDLSVEIGLAGETLKFVRISEFPCDWWVGVHCATATATQGRNSEWLRRLELKSRSAASVQWRDGPGPATVVADGRLLLLLLLSVRALPSFPSPSSLLSTPALDVADAE
jgi:hypothetical protein